MHAPVDTRFELKGLTKKSLPSTPRHPVRSCRHHESSDSTIFDERTLGLNPRQFVASKLAERKVRPGVLMAAVQAAHDMIAIVDRRGLIEYVNPAFSRGTGYASQEAVGRPISILKSNTHDRIFYRNLWQVILSGNVWHGEITNRRKDGTKYSEEQSITPIQDGRGKVVRFIAIKRDISDRKKAERELASAHEETIIRLVRAAEQRDNETGDHIQRMGDYCGWLAHLAGLPSNRCEVIRLASVMHDIGKIGIPDRVLLKPGPLTPHEFAIMKQHTEIGHRILVGSNAELFTIADAIAWTHHERYDGSGYPRGLAGDAIPLEGRIAAIADAFDAITSKRVYKQACSIQQAAAIMRKGRGSHFDPHLLDLFLANLDELAAIKKRCDEKETRTRFFSEAVTELHVPASE